MTPSDWLYEVRNELQEVQSENQVFTVGVREDLDNVNLSLTLTQQSDSIEAYVVVEPTSNVDINTAIDTVDEVASLIATDDSADRPISTERNNRWAESHFEVDPKSVESL